MYLLSIAGRSGLIANPVGRPWLDPPTWLGLAGSHLCGPLVLGVPALLLVLVSVVSAFMSPVLFPFLSLPVGGISSVAALFPSLIGLVCLCRYSTCYLVRSCCFDGARASGPLPLRLPL